MMGSANLHANANSNCNANSNSNSSSDSNPNLDRERWAGLLGPHLAHALAASGSYSEAAIEAHMNFFKTHVCGWLGPGPKPSQPLQAACPSALTSDATPFEWSYSWKGTSSVAVRYVVDVVPPCEELSRAASLAKAKKMIAELRGCGREMDVLPDVWEAVTALLADFEDHCHPGGRCDECDASSTFVGFDLAAGGRARGKLYWRLPACQPTEDVLPVLDAIFALLPKHCDGAQVDNYWAQARRHFVAQPKTPTALRPRMLSIDASHYPAPRIKLYSRCYFDSHATFGAAVEPHLSLGEAVALPLSQHKHKHKHYQSVWDRLRTQYRASPQCQRYCLVLYDMVPDKPLDTKLYWFAKQLPGADGLIILNLLDDFAQPAAFLRRQLDAGHFSVDSKFIREIGMGQRGHGYEITTYVSPALFSF